jgi:hypothetical protein
MYCGGVGPIGGGRRDELDLWISTRRTLFIELHEYGHNLLVMQECKKH